MITLLRASYQDELRVPIFTGLSTDGYPEGTDIINGTEFHCIDNGVNYRYDSENNGWHVIPSEGGGGGDTPFLKINQFIPMELGTSCPTYENSRFITLANGKACTEAFFVVSTTRPVTLNAYRTTISDAELNTYDSLEELYSFAKENEFSGWTSIITHNVDTYYSYDFKLKINLPPASGVANNYIFCAELIDAESGEVVSHDIVNNGKVVLNPSDVSEYTYKGSVEVTPTTTNTSLATNGKAVTSDIIVRGDANLVPENIASGVSIFGVQGEHEGGEGADLPRVEYETNSSNEIISATIKNMNVIPSSIFYYCSSLRNVAFPSGVTTIMNNAFYNCTNLALTSLPSSIISIRTNAFRSCTNLALTSLPSGLPTITDYAFAYCTNLPLTELPSGVISIGQYAFHSCTNLALTSLPSGLTSIGNNAFQACTSLALTELPSSLTKLSSNAFYDCPSLALTELPSGITAINPFVFSGCTNLALTELPSGVRTISNNAFDGCTKLALTSLPSGVTSIGQYAFRNCTSLALTELPSGITSISNYAFVACTNLALTELPSGITSIGQYAFENCTNLALTELPSSLTSINANAFRNCTGLTTLTFKRKLTSLPSTAFNGCTNLTTINVPWAQGAVSGAPWGATNATINYNVT